MTGRGVDRDPERAVFWFQKAADQKLHLAQAALGDCHRDRSCVPKDMGVVVMWYRQAAEQGLLRAQLELARFSL